jgi:hypothetical protein
MNTEKKVEEPIDINVNEELDGSATVELPEDLVPHQENEEKHEVKAEDHDDHQDDDPSESKVQRNRRKQKRELAKAVSSEKELQLNLLRKQNEELMTRLAVVEKKTHNADLARIDKAIEDQETRVNYAKIKMAEAMSAGDGETYSQAQEIWLEARNQVSALKNSKDQASRPQVQNNIPDPRLQRHASEWMERNAWYNPNGSDIDSRIAKIVDEELVKEGWNPNDSDYWDELDNRLSKRINHRYNDSMDVKPSSKGPRSVVTSSGRESVNGNSNRSTFTLQPEQVRAMKDAGMWDDPAKRAKMIKRYAMSARNNQY